MCTFFKVTEVLYFLNYIFCVTFTTIKIVKVRRGSLYYYCTSLYVILC